jgi:carbamate kinase
LAARDCLAAAKQIIELDVVQTLLDNGICAITVGGGGIPVIEDENGNYLGTRQSLTRTTLITAGAEDQRRPLPDFDGGGQGLPALKQPDQRALDVMTISEARQYWRKATLRRAAWPQNRGLLWYMDAGGKEAIITDPAHIIPALRGEAGTRIIRVSRAMSHTTQKKSPKYRDI